MNNYSYTQDLPCHFFHTSVCHFKPCPYSHDGEPTGICVNSSCAICLKQSFISHIQQQQQQQFFQFQQEQQRMMQQQQGGADPANKNIAAPTSPQSQNPLFFNHILPPLNQENQHKNQISNIYPGSEQQQQSNQENGTAEKNDDNNNNKTGQSAPQGQGWSVSKRVYLPPPGEDVMASFMMPYRRSKGQQQQQQQSQQQQQQLQQQQQQQQQLQQQQQQDKMNFMSPSFFMYDTSLQNNFNKIAQTQQSPLQPQQQQKVGKVQQSISPTRKLKKSSTELVSGRIIKDLPYPQSFQKNGEQNNLSMIKENIFRGRNNTNISSIVAGCNKNYESDVNNYTFQGISSVINKNAKEVNQKQRNVQSDTEHWGCIRCGYEQNSYTVHQCRKCELPKINKKLDFEFNGEYDQKIDYLLVIDFECTCTEDNSLELMEIIEFPIIVINVQKHQIVNTFHSFVKPTVNEQLSEFCTKLTGITQKQVDKANPIQKVLKAAHHFIEPYLDSNIAILNDCNADMKFLLRESEYKNIDLPDYMKKYVNLKKIFPNLTKTSTNSQGLAIQQKSFPKKIKDLDSMLMALGLEFQGRKHSGIADTKNIAKVVIELLNRGYKFTMRLTESIYPYGQTLGNQNFKYMLLIQPQIEQKGNRKRISEVGGVIVNLHKNQVIWNNIFHHILASDSKKEYQTLLQKIQDTIIGETELKNQDFLVASLGRMQIDMLNYELNRHQIELPKYFARSINLKREIPSLRKKAEKKTSLTNEYLIEEAMKILDIEQKVKPDPLQKSSSLIEAMNLSQIVRKLVIKGHIFSADSQK